MRGRRTKPHYYSRGRCNVNFDNDSEKKQASRYKLPIEAKMTEIINAIANNQVVVISGRTGCGKSTQVPQYIFRHAMANKQSCKIICTQPRRLAAVSLAKRVAYEMNSNIGGLVGYQIGFESFFSKSTAILFATTGIFLKRLVNSTSLSEFSHVIFDEVHERDLSNDFSMVAAKYILQANTRLKVVVMSATFDTELFSSYFSPVSIRNILSPPNISPLKIAPAEELKQPIKVSSGWSSDENNSLEEEKEETIIENTREGYTTPCIRIDESKYTLEYYYLDDIYGRGESTKISHFQYFIY